MSKDKTNAERQRRFRARRRESNGGVTAGIGEGLLVTDPSAGIVTRAGHVYYTNAAGQVFAVVCCGVDGCQLCGFKEVK